MKKLSIGGKILAALILALVVGLILYYTGNNAFADNYIKPFGTIFLNLLKFIVVPVVFFSIVCGIVNLKDIRKVGRIGISSLIFYTVTTLFAIIVGLVGGSLFKRFFPVISTVDLKSGAEYTSNFMDTLVGLFPSNIVAPFSSANMLQIIFVAIIFGFAIIIIESEKSKPAADLFYSLNEVSMKIMDLILQLAPIGVFCMLCPVIAANGTQIIGSLATVLLAAYISYAFHMLTVYSLCVKTLGGISPKKFFKEMYPAMAFAFSSASSVGTLPFNIESCNNLGCDKEVTSFTLPLGATINMDGTAIYQGVCVIFIAACYGIDLTFSQLISVVVTSTLASIGTAGVPGAGVVMLSMVLSSVGLPLEGIALVAGIDRIFDMGRTVVNITGDAACSVCVSNILKKSETK